ncbi:hypothetical protein K8M07_03355 [Schnuerera sp. xch1]|uniref:hypothetical protein n=1 Tax=Schnuerera sp. xch1 TaxID=2874283 RepID=UPI001CBCC326|nr:hypothetical protein [Schnuerera sp. xch1]MBZ2174279.1 hypothetical protein [Schnuerera sp. xch1]
MERCLLSVDWDYFVSTKSENFGSYIENKRTIIDLWYKRYIQSKTYGKDIRDLFHLSSEVNNFWNKIKCFYRFEKDIRVYVSDSHTLSYTIAKDNNCNVVYLFDAHADLGYGGLSSLDFEVNCANWLGKLFKNKEIEEAHIIYSPFTFEEPKYFQLMNNIYNIDYPEFKDLDTEINVSVIHICRSGAWTPPWFDKKFIEFVNELDIPYKVIECPLRKWSTKDISYSDQLHYMMA